MAVDCDHPHLAGGVDGAAGRAVESRAGVNGDFSDQEDPAANRDRAEDLAVQHRRGECRRGEVGHASRNGDVEVALHAFGEVAVEQAKHDAQVSAQGTSVQGSFKVGDVVVGDGNKGTAGAQVGGPQGVSPASVAEDDRHADPACQQHTPRPA